MSDKSIFRVAINAPLSRLFDYHAPRGHSLTPGCRVRVPFGRRSQVGMLMEVTDQSDLPQSKLRAASDAIDLEPLLSADDLWLIRFTADYYHHPIGEVVAAALPAPLRQGKSLAHANSTRMISITKAGMERDLDALGKRAKRQAELLSIVKDNKQVSSSTLDESMPSWRRFRKALLDKELICESIRECDEQSTSECMTSECVRGPTLNPDQHNAIQTIRRQSGFRAIVLDGVTGSGKTEVYLHLIKEETAAGRQVLVIVPEIGLTPQLVGRFQRRLGIEPAVLHSGLTDTARLAAWRDARSGRTNLVVGTRSAIFVPLKNPGLIIVDEEHDNSLKQQEGLRYSARDLAVARAKRHDIPIVLGSATPSLETLHRCREGAYDIARLPSRAGNAVPSLMRLVDLSRYESVDGLSDPVVGAIENTVSSDGQVLIYLNRRGFAPTLICSGCGIMAECSHCDSRMTVHASSSLLKCHHCGAQQAIEIQCSHCGAQRRPLGQGTERLEDALRTRFPDEIITRIDSDSTRLKGTMSKALAMATSGETRILVGTQMLSKGHHFPNLTLVVVINADQGLFSTDFRGAEKLAQSLVQVGGRAGREERQGEVIIQTAFPKHPFWNELFTGGYATVAASALRERETAVWPPFSRLALLRSSAANREDAHTFLIGARECAEQAGVTDVRILGPVSAPMERKAGRVRAQLLLQSQNRGNLHQLLSILRQSLEGSRAARRVRWSIDVDPIELF